MGSEIVHRLIDCGFRVHLYNRSTTKLTGLIEKGAMREVSPKNLADKCDFVLLCVTDGEAVKQVCFGDNGIAMSNNSDLIVVDLSYHITRRCNLLCIKTQEKTYYIYSNASHGWARPG